MNYDLDMANLRNALAKYKLAKIELEALIEKTLPRESTVEWEFNHKHGTSRATGKVCSYDHTSPGRLYVENERTGGVRAVYVNLSDLQLIERPA